MPPREPPFYVDVEKVLIFPVVPLVLTSRFLVQIGHPLDGVPSLPPLPPRSLTYGVNHAIVIVHTYPHVYGHILNEIFPAFAGIPAEIWHKSILFVPHRSMTSVIAELLDILGKRPLGVVNTKRIWIFAQHLYVPNPWIFVQIWPDCVRSLRTRVIAKLGLENLVPNTYLIRQRANNRIIVNVDQLFAAAVKTFPKKHWVLLRDQRQTMKEQIAFWASVALACLASGSAAANGIWMRPGTVLIEVHVRWCDPFYAFVARAVGMKVFTTAVTIGNRKAFVVDVPFMISLIERGCQFLEQHGPR
jgi:capsular polysaccharide biosynthesis protein